MNILLTIFIISVFSSAQLVYALEHCDDQHGGYCIEDGSRGCCVHGPPLCCKDGHGDCIPRLGFNYNNAKCERLECPEGEVCMPLGGEGKDKCVPKVLKRNPKSLKVNRGLLKIFGYILVPTRLRIGTIILGILTSTLLPF